MKKIVELKNATVQVNNGLDDVKTILDSFQSDCWDFDVN